MEISNQEFTKTIEIVELALNQLSNSKSNQQKPNQQEEAHSILDMKQFFYKLFFIFSGTISLLDRESNLIYYVLELGLDKLKNQQINLFQTWYSILSFSSFLATFTIGMVFSWIFLKEMNEYNIPLFIFNFFNAAKIYAALRFQYCNKNQYLLKKYQIYQTKYTLVFLILEDIPQLIFQIMQFKINDSWEENAFSYIVVATTILNIFITIVTLLQQLYRLCTKQKQEKDEPKQPETKLYEQNQFKQEKQDGASRQIYIAASQIGKQQFVKESSDQVIFQLKQCQNFVQRFNEFYK